MKTSPLEPFGLEIRGLDLSQSHDDDTIAEVRRLWGENGLLLFRGQSLDEADLVRFSGRFGTLEIHVREEYLSAEHPQVLLVSNLKADGKPVGILGDHEVGWHHDQSYRERPALGSMLYAVTLPPAGGETCFCDLAGAYEALPETRRAELEGLRAVHSYAHFNGTWSEPTSDEQTRRTPDVTHPVVRTHPETGRKSLFVNFGHTVRFEGWTRAESETRWLFASP